MENRRAFELLDILIGNAARILVAGFGCRGAEANLFGVLRVVRETPEAKGWLIARITRSMAKRDLAHQIDDYVPIELVELLAHEFRWEELKEIAQRRVENLFDGDWIGARGDIASDIVDAMSEDWSDREFYSHYANVRHITN
ncbi:MAG: hypothetical protein AB8G17_20715 [Gammaproteobacteria bacterium]